MIMHQIQNVIIVNANDPHTTHLTNLTIGQFKALLWIARKSSGEVLFIAICLKCYFLLIESLASLNRLQKQTQRLLLSKMQIAEIVIEIISSLNERAIRRRSENMLK